MTEEKTVNLPHTAPNLFSVWQITAAAFIGSPLAGCLLLAQNYKNLEKIGAAWKSLAAGVISTIILFTTAYLLPKNLPGSALPAIYTVIIYQAAKVLQGNEIAAQEKRGKSGSWITTIAVGLGCLILIVAVIIVAAFLLTAE